MRERYFIVVYQLTRSIHAIDLTDANHAKFIGLGSSQCTHAARAINCDSLIERVQYFFVPYRERLQKHAIDETDHIRFFIDDCRQQIALLSRRPKNCIEDLTSLSKRQRRT